MLGPIFISYASADQDTADRLVREIERRNVPCWIASRNIRPGEDYQRAIVSALESCSAVLLLFSENASQSTEIPRELGLAGKYRKTVIPARLQDIVPSGSLAYQLTTAQFIDLFVNFEAKVDELCLRLAEFHQAAGPVRERITQERAQRESTQRLKWAGLLGATGIVCVALLVTIGPKAWTWMNGHQADTLEPADSKLVEPAATRPVEPTSTTSPQPRPRASTNAPVAVAPPTEPISVASPQRQPGVSASAPVAVPPPTPSAAVAAGSSAGVSAPGVLGSRDV